MIAENETAALQQQQQRRRQRMSIRVTGDWTELADNIALLPAIYHAP